MRITSQKHFAMVCKLCQLEHMPRVATSEFKKVDFCACGLLEFHQSSS